MRSHTRLEALRYDGLCCPRRSSLVRPPPTSARRSATSRAALIGFAVTGSTRAASPGAGGFRCRDGSLLFRAGLCDRSAPTTPTGLWCCSPRSTHRSWPSPWGSWARHPHVPRSREGSSRRGYRIPLVRTDHLLAAPKATLSWRFDSQVSPSAGHQLRGRLAATPTGLPPASPAQLSGHTPDELTSRRPSPAWPRSGPSARRGGGSEAWPGSDRSPGTPPGTAPA